MTLIPENHDALLTRDQTAAALTAAGFPVKAKTLATKATRGGGPPYRPFGPRVLYRWGDALDWARERLGSARRSTSEADHANALFPEAETFAEALVREADSGLLANATPRRSLQGGR